MNARFRTYKYCYSNLGFIYAKCLWKLAWVFVVSLQNIDYRRNVQLVACSMDCFSFFFLPLCSFRCNSLQSRSNRASDFRFGAVQLVQF